MEPRKVGWLQEISEEAKEILDLFWWWHRFKGPGSSPRRQQQRKTHSEPINIINNNNNNNMLGATQDQLAPIRLSGHTLDKATKAKVAIILLLIMI